jgi:hypothetical protein
MLTKLFMVQFSISKRARYEWYGGIELDSNVSPIQKQTRKTMLSVGRNDKGKKFHIIFTAERIEIPIPPNLKGQIEEMAFDFSCGIKVNMLIEACKEAQRLIAEGYTEEEAPCEI